MAESKAHPQVIEIAEHGCITEDADYRLLKESGADIATQRKDINDHPHYLGLTTPYTPGCTTYQAGYYVGLQWIKEPELALMVSPKIKDIDYLSMLMTCVKNPATSMHVKGIYEIDFKNTPIKHAACNFELTPFIIIHFLGVVRKIIKKGLRRDYSFVEENLHSKIKGKLLLQQQIKHNEINGRRERQYCRYQEYTVDCMENRIIKKALDFSSRYLTQHCAHMHALLDMYRSVQSAFAGVSDIQRHEIRHHTPNPFYTEYAEAIRIATIILKQFDFSMQKAAADKKEHYPPFSINMALLFELFAYSKLHDKHKNDVIYHARGIYGETDFLCTSHQAILDTKYKKTYAKEEYDIGDIRQLSGYARDKSILEQIGISTNGDNTVPVVDCIIIYPNKEGGDDIPDNFASLKKDAIAKFHNFYKYGIRLPCR